MSTDEYNIRVSNKLKAVENMETTIELKNLGTRKLKKLMGLLNEMAAYQQGEVLKNTQESIKEIQKELDRKNKVLGLK